MDFDFETSELWKKTLGLTNDANQDKINILKASFTQTRERIEKLLGEIPSLFPGYTVHNILHSDALWHMTDIILTGSEIKLNPVEAYVLGCSFLFHDLGMSPAIYGDKSSLRETDLWKDSYAYFIREKYTQGEAQRKADEETIRKQHALNAKELPLFRFDAEKGFKKEYTYLIENSNLRDSFGNTIGEIAASHGLAIDEIEKEILNEKISPSGFPSQWKFCPLKLACILRIVDAMHITADRTPYILWFTQKLDNLSRLHWNFHSKLHNPSVQKGQLVYISNSNFSKSERESWWLCYDTLKMINQELLDVDALFSRHDIPSLGAYCVKNIDSPKSISRQIEVEGWTPVESQMKVTNVSGLINSLGGSALYGNNDFVPLRELVQNASDAIRAKRLMDEKDEKWGDIHIRVKDVADGTIIEVEDNGIGMSENVLTGPFLDFGTSFWHSNLMQKELPGLESKKFESTGHFGIGFFSVFMWGDEVTITTLGYGMARKETLVLEFKAGTKSRPLLRPAESKEQLKDSGTKIQVRLKRKWPENIRFDEGDSLVSYISRLFPCMDCNLFFAENENPSRQIISANDWIDMDSFEFLKRVCVYGHAWNVSVENKEKYLKNLSKRVCLIKSNDGKILGRGTLDACFKGLLCVGGIKASSTFLFVGVLQGKCNIANRFSAFPTVSEEMMKSWLEEQTNFLYKDLSWQKYDSRLFIATLLYSFGIPTGPITVAYNQDKSLNRDQVKEIIEKTKEKKYVVLEEFYRGFFEEKLMSYNKNVFFSNGNCRTISSCDVCSGEEYFTDCEFPSSNWQKELAGIVAEICAEVWHEDVKDIETCSTDKAPIYEIIGTFAGEEITRFCHSVIERTSTKIKNSPVKRPSKKSCTKKRAKK